MKNSMEQDSRPSWTEKAIAIVTVNTSLHHCLVQLNRGKEQLGKAYYDLLSKIGQESLEMGAELYVTCWVLAAMRVNYILLRHARLTCANNDAGTIFSIDEESTKTGILVGVGIAGSILLMQNLGSDASKRELLTTMGIGLMAMIRAYLGIKVLPNYQEPLDACLENSRDPSKDYI